MPVQFPEALCDVLKLLVYSDKTTNPEICRFIITKENYDLPKEKSRELTKSLGCTLCGP